MPVKPRWFGPISVPDATTQKVKVIFGPISLAEAATWGLGDFNTRTKTYYSCAQCSSSFLGPLLHAGISWYRTKGRVYLVHGQFEHWCRPETQGPVAQREVLRESKFRYPQMPLLNSSAWILSRKKKDGDSYALSCHIHKFPCTQSNSSYHYLHHPTQCMVRFYSLHHHHCWLTTQQSSR